MKRIGLCKFNALLLLAGLCVMGSCTEDELPAPMKKARTVVKLTADWSECSSAAPAKYMVRIGNETQEVTGNVNSFLLLSTSDYGMVAYNEPQGVSVNGNIATLNTAATRSEGSSVVTGNPDDLFSVSEDLVQDELLALTGDTLRLTVKMQQRTRQVNITMDTDVESIKSVTGMLDNVVSSIDLTTGELLSVAKASVSFAASPVAEGEASMRLKGTVRLLGVSQEKAQRQIMTVEITKEDETTETITTDLTEVLSKLDEGGNTPLDIEGRGGFNGNVINWVVEEKGDLDWLK
ncbi:FimB/Mfa2 family fimbrial subunit [Bacteroides clarus]|uniref:FimB/Mfa2 family fimbrial subunit n=1 Tax=Bacteroides clarus TaxID=626929 RepID=UPI00248D7414|nr:FimB/Mfa2 family fimbrial subunit [Bacteroides clarus]